MADTDTATTTEVRQNLAKYLHIAADGGTVYITNNGFRIAAIVPVAVADQAALGKR